MALVTLQPVELSFCSRSASFLQSDFWGNFKSQFGWSVFSFKTEWIQPNGKSSLNIELNIENSGYPLLVLYRHLAPGFGLAYIPWGPELKPPDFIKDGGSNAIVDLAQKLRLYLPKDTLLVRFDFPWYSVNKEPKHTFSKPLCKAAVDIQAPDSVFLDLQADEKTILDRMKSKWRYNIGLAEKKGVIVRQGNKDFLDSFYRLYKETAQRDGISIHSEKYYETLLEEAAKYSVDIRLYLASHDGEDIAGIITLFRGTEAIYLYGASSNNKRNLMAAYSLQWRAIKDAKAAGCTVYDFYGIPPKPPNEDPRHAMVGLYRFKTGFIGDGEGGRIIHRPGCYDYLYRPFAGAMFTTAEKFRKAVNNFKKRR